MAIQEKKIGIQNTLFEDAVCPVPGGQGDWGKMGKCLAEDPGETRGTIPPGVQYATNIDGAPGIGDATNYKTAGSSRGGSGMGR